MQGEACVPGGCTLGSHLGFRKVGGVGWVGGGRGGGGGGGGEGRTACRLEAGGGCAWGHQDAEEVVLRAGVLEERSG